MSAAPDPAATTPDPTFDWPALLRLAAGRFLIPPEAFWRLSVAEWRALTEGGGPDPLPRADLEALLRQFPDKTP
jgi:uncharacterized phage protein (TIGR02216 family)